MRTGRILASNWTGPCCGPAHHRDFLATATEAARRSTRVLRTGSMTSPTSFKQEIPTHDEKQFLRPHKLMRRDALIPGNRQEVRHGLCPPDKRARRDGRTALAFYYAPGLDVV